MKIFLCPWDCPERSSSLVACDHCQSISFSFFINVYILANNGSTNLPTTIEKCYPAVARLQNFHCSSETCQCCHCLLLLLLLLLLLFSHIIFVALSCLLYLVQMDYRIQRFYHRFQALWLKHSLQIRFILMPTGDSLS